jgi:hypothetical protein
MATNQYGQTEWDADPETAAELRRLSNQEKMAAAMMQRGQVPLTGGMVGNTYVGASPLQGLANMFHQYNASKATQGAEQGYKALSDRKAQEYASAISDYKRNTVGTPEQPMGPPTPEGEMGVKPAFAPSPDQRRQAIIEAAVSTNPRLSKMGQMDFQMDARKEDKQDAIRARMDELQLRIAEGRITKEEADKRAADLRREMQESAFANQKSMVQLAAGLRQEPAPTVTEIVKDGKAVKVDARTGRVIGEALVQGKGKGMTPTAQKELIQTDEEIQGGAQALEFLKAAKGINSKAMGGLGSGAIANVGSILPAAIRPQTVDDTVELDNILQSSALPQLKAIFGGMPTEGERKILLDVQGSSGKTKEVREGIFKRAEDAVNARLRFAKEKAKSLRDGTYFSDDGTPKSSASGASGEWKDL